MVRPAQGDEVLELGGTAVRPVDDVVAIGPRGRTVAPGEAAALVAEVERGAEVAGMVRVARPTESGVAPVPAAVEAQSSADGATVTMVRTASQARRRAVSGWIGPTPRNSAGGASAPVRSGPRSP
jgi:hypothetical protein